LPWTLNPLKTFSINDPSILWKQNLMTFKQTSWSCFILIYFNGKFLDSESVENVIPLITLESKHSIDSIKFTWFDFNWTRMQKHWERIKVNQGNKSCSLKSRIFLTILSSSLLNSNVYKPVVIWWYKTNLSIHNIVCFVLGETFGGEWFLFSLKFYFYFKFKYLNKQQQQKVKRLWFL
jgi:hypothetical protein